MFKLTSLGEHFACNTVIFMSPYVRNSHALTVRLINRRQWCRICLTRCSPQTSASAPHCRRPPLRWERCSTRPLPGITTYTWDEETRDTDKYRGKIYKNYLHCQIQNSTVYTVQINKVLYTSVHITSHRLETSSALTRRKRGLPWSHSWWSGPSPTPPPTACGPYLSVSACCRAHTGKWRLLLKPELLP